MTYPISEDGQFRAMMEAMVDPEERMERTEAKLSYECHAVPYFTKYKSMKTKTQCKK